MQLVTRLTPVQITVLSLAVFLQRRFTSRDIANEMDNSRSKVSIAFVERCLRNMLLRNLVDFDGELWGITQAGNDAVAKFELDNTKHIEKFAETGIETCMAVAEVLTDSSIYLDRDTRNKLIASCKKLLDLSMLSPSYSGTRFSGVGELIRTVARAKQIQLTQGANVQKEADQADTD